MGTLADSGGFTQLETALAAKLGLKGLGRLEALNFEHLPAL